MTSLFNDIYGVSVADSLLEIFREHDEWEYFERYPDSEPVKVVVHAGNVETRILEILEKEKKVRERILVLMADPDHEHFPGLREVHKAGVFKSPDGELWSVSDDDADIRSGSLLRVKVRFARATKLDRYQQV